MPKAKKSATSAGEQIGIYIVSSLMRRAKDAATNPTTALAGVVFSAFSVEAFTNAFLDFVWNLSDREKSTEGLRVLAATVTLSGLRDPTERKPLPQKLEMIAEALGAQTPLFKRQPFQGLNWVIEARNLLAHGRVEYLELTPARIQAVTYAVLLREISARSGAPKPHTISFQEVVEFLDQPTIASWAFNVAHDVVTEMVSWLPAADMQEEMTASLGVPSRIKR